MLPCLNYNKCIEFNNKHYIVLFAGCLDGHKDVVQCLRRHPTSLSNVLSGSCDGQVCLICIHVITDFVPVAAFVYTTVIVNKV